MPAVCRRAPFSFVFDESADPVLQIDSSFRSPPGVLRFRSHVEEAALAQEFLRACVSIAVVFLPSIFAPVHRSFSGLRDPQSAWPQLDFSSAKLFASATDLFACSGFRVLALALTPDLRFLYKAEGAGRVSFAELILQFVSVWFSSSAHFSGSRIGFAVQPRWSSVFRSAAFASLCCR
jgi:hypothetical protein